MARERRGSYYLSRIIKAGQLNKETLLGAISNSATVLVGKYAWTITDVKFFERDNQVVYAFGKLSKYSLEGTVKIVGKQGKKKIETDLVQPNLIEASSPFVYIPEFSGIAYLHVWNKIEREVFARRFSTIIEANFDNFFVECKIEPITDLHKFVERLMSIESFIEISAKVRPPNPLFGRVWENLKEYLEHRQATEMSVKERGDENYPLNSNLLKHIQGLTSQSEEKRYTPNDPVDITDAAILMATDGYGDGKIIGIEKETQTTITLKISEKHINFLFGREPHPDDLFENAYKQFKRISNERNMEHK
ncbi:MAG: hypothetical protein DRI32_07070 [Chloroflexi bacterium]|nr:MAG: hypothetical protein DRI32_07070 [Chloroflexota bacterium]